jgi:chromosome segregation ATPase
VRTQNYVAENKSDHTKTLVIEHPRQSGWDLVDTLKPMETTDAVYRFKGDIAAGEKNTLKVTEQMVTDQEVALLASTPDQFLLYSTASQIPKPVQDALNKVIQLKSALTDTQQQIDQSKARLADITTEQNRIREDMRAVDRNTQYYTRLMTKLNDQESEIEKTQAQLAQLQKTLVDQQQALESYLENLNAG